MLSLGSMHLSECFAKTVEFEHLIWFNRDAPARLIINNWMFDDEVITYNLPLRLFLQTCDLSSRGRLGLVWAHLRVFIDVALIVQ